MAKASITVTILAACIAAIYAAPAPQGTDWAAVAATVKELQYDVISASFQEIITTANNEDPDLRINETALSYQVNYAHRFVREAFRQLEYDIANEALTTEGLHNRLYFVHSEIGRLSRILEEYLAHFSEETAEQIRLTFFNLHGAINEKESEVRRILVTPMQTDWAAVALAVSELQYEVISSSFQEIIRTADQDDASVRINGTALSYQVNYAQRFIREAFRQLEYDIAGETLTTEHLHGKKDFIHYEIYRLAGILEEYLPLFSDAASEQIKQILTKLPGVINDKVSEVHRILVTPV